MGRNLREHVAAALRVTVAIALIIVGAFGSFSCRSPSPLYKSCCMRSGNGLFKAGCQDVVMKSLMLLVPQTSD